MGAGVGIDVSASRLSRALETAVGVRGEVARGSGIGHDCLIWFAIYERPKSVWGFQADQEEHIVLWAFKVVTEAQFDYDYSQLRVRIHHNVQEVKKLNEP